MSNERPVWLYVLGGCAGVLLLGAVASCFTCTACVAAGNEGGTRYANTMEPYALAYLEAHHTLQPGESIVAYYDATLTLDATEAAIVTDRRVVYHNQGVDTAIALAEITDIQSREEPLIGTVIDVIGAAGQQIHVEVAPLNDGPGFLGALMRQRDAARAP